jgi:hypothetical protein
MHAFRHANRHPNALYKQQHLKCLSHILLQAIFDATASFGGFYVGQIAKDAEGFPFR